MKLNKIKLKWKIFAYVLVFSIVVVSLFVFFQMFMLERFYKNTKINNMESLFDDIETLIINETDLNNDEFSQKIREKSGEEETSIVLFNETNNIVTQVGQNDVIFKLQNPDTMNKVRSSAPSNKKFYISFTSNFGPMPKMGPQEVTVFDNSSEFKKASKDSNIICGKIISYQGNNNYLLILESRLTPVAPAVKAFQSQLLYISIIILVLAVGIALFIASRISKPIKKMTDTANELAKGKRDIVFEGSGFAEIEELDNTLNYAVAELNKTDTLQKELLANISHDLKTPLTLISGYAEMMKDIPEENTPENLQLIVDEVNRLNELVNDLVPLAKLQAGTEEFNIKEVNLTKLLSEIIDRQQKLLESQEFTINFDFTDYIIIDADQHKLEQVIYNFITNAVNYSGDSKLIEVKQEIIGDEVKISVKDHGIGIKEEDLKVIWNRYYRVDKGHKRSVKGSGLGLAIAKEILQYHKFKYGAESVVNEYSIFYFIAPIKKKEAK